MIAKRLVKPSNKLAILKSLSPSQHIDSFTVATESYIIFTKHRRIHGTSAQHLVGEIVKPCRSLLDGVAYLHDNGIAHLDLKPDNLVYDDAGQLRIIDFDLAKRVEGESTEVYPWMDGA